MKTIKGCGNVKGESVKYAERIYINAKLVRWHLGNVEYHRHLNGLSHRVIRVRFRKVHGQILCLQRVWCTGSVIQCIEQNVNVQ